jgi:formylmethanofuran dehydrogenase subunit E
MTETDDTPRMIWASRSRPIYHTDGDCSWRGTKGPKIPLETAEAWDYRECEHCDPDVDSHGSSPTGCDDCGRWRNRSVVDRNGRMLCLDCRERRLTKGDSE